EMWYVRTANNHDTRGQWIIPPRGLPLQAAASMKVRPVRKLRIVRMENTGRHRDALRDAQIVRDHPSSWNRIILGSIAAHCSLRYLPFFTSQHREDHGR